MREPANLYDRHSMPVLRILSLDSLIPHEHHDVQRTAPLAMRIAADGVLKNPPVVTPLGDGDHRLVVLDGVNRVAALRGMGCPHIPVQVVEYSAPQVILSTWNQVVTEISLEEFDRGIADLPGVDYLGVDLLEARAGLAQREYLACIVRPDGSIFAVRTSVPTRDLHEKNRFLNALVNTYQSRTRLHRTMLDDVHEVWNLHPAMKALVLFPELQYSEILLLAREGELLPAGLTRHLIQQRALSLNYPLEALKSYDALEEKNRRFTGWIQQRVSSRGVRYYGETTFLFDE